MQNKFYGPDDVINVNGELQQLVNAKFEAGEYTPYLYSGVEFKIKNLPREYTDKQLSDFCDYYQRNSKWMLIYSDYNREINSIWFIFSQVECNFVKI